MHCTTWYNRAVVSKLQGALFVRNITILVGDHDQRTVDEDGVGHVLRHGDAALIVKLDVAYARLHGHGDVPYRRIQSNVFDFAEIPKERLHLVFGGLWRDVSHLNDLRRADRHSGRELSPFIRTERK